MLQTLALIQNRAGASSEAGGSRAPRSASCDWLHDGGCPGRAATSRPTCAFAAAALELDYPVRIDVVAVGMSDERASGELAAAAREAMLNAARHAGGEVSVYLEGSAPRSTCTSATAARIRPGEGWPGRLGVRESIIGRMRRAGGSATVRPGAGGEGTEVHLRFGDRG